MVKSPFADAYKNPWDDSKDRGYLSALTDMIQRWFKARNGQHEEIELECMWGIDKPTGQSLTLIIKCHVRPK